MGCPYGTRPSTGRTSDRSTAQRLRSRRPNKTMFRVLTFLFASVTLLWAADADLILHNGKIVTVDKQFSIQQAVAIRSGAIVAVGSDKSVLHTQRGPKTELIELYVRTRMPWLVDAPVPRL